MYDDPGAEKMNEFTVSDVLLTADGEKWRWRLSEAQNVKT